MREEGAGIIPTTTRVLIRVTVTIAPIVASALTMHAFRRVQLHRQILQLERMIGNFLLDPLLTRTGKANSKVSGWPHRRWARPRRMENASGVTVMGILRCKAFEEGVVSNEIIASVRSALELCWLIFLTTSAPSRVFLAKIGLHLVAFVVLVFWCNFGINDQARSFFWGPSYSSHEIGSFPSFQSALIIIGETMDDQNGQDIYYFSDTPQHVIRTSEHNLAKSSQNFSSVLSQ